MDPRDRSVMSTLWTMARGQGRRGNLTRSLGPPLSKPLSATNLFLSAGPPSLPYISHP
jgi:hypothetical protein